MKFRINQLFAFIAIVAVFLALRSWWTACEDDAIAGYSPLVVATLVGVYAGWCQSTLRTILVASVLAGFMTSSSFALELVLHSPASLFQRDRIAEMYYDMPLLKAHGVFVTTALSGALGLFCGWAVSRSRTWIVEHRTELSIISIAALASFAFGMFVHGLGVADFVLRERFVFGTVSVGTVLATAWVCSNRSFPRPPKNAG